MDRSPVVERLGAPPEEAVGLLAARGTFYHDPRWVAAVAGCFRFPVHWLVARDGTAIVGVLALAEVPRLLGRPRLVSFPFSYAAGPVAGDAPTDRALCEAAIALARERGASRVDIKRPGEVMATHPDWSRSARYATYVLDTSGTEDVVLGRLHASTRRGIRKAEREGVSVERDASEDGWLAMARLQENSSRRHGVPPPPRRFFSDTCRSLQQEGLADLLLARVDGSAVAGLVLWTGSRERIYAFGASLQEFLERRPNHLLLWTAVRGAMTAGVPLDLGRAAPEQHGLVQFKTRWGGHPRLLAYDYWPEAGGLHAAPRDQGVLALGAAVWSRLPVAVARAGSAFYRYLG